MDKSLVTTSPHIFNVDSTKGIMLDVIIALIPAVLAGAFIFGIRALLVVTVCALSAVVAEYITCRILKRNTTVTDLSACLTGILLGLNLPSNIPLWMAVIGSVVAIVVVKQLFGGLGKNFANPAITARIVLLVSFPTAMTNYINPAFSTDFSSVNAITSATPLVNSEAYTVKQLFLGLHSGSIGETCAILLIAGGIYLIVRKVISPVIPLSFVGTFAVLSFIFNLTSNSVLNSGILTLKAVLSGGLLLGAIFMATDYVTTPRLNKARTVYGIGCGIFTFIIRYFGSLPEGVSYAILLMNIITPHLDNIFISKPFGSEVKNND